MRLLSFIILTSLFLDIIACALRVGRTDDSSTIFEWDATVANSYTNHIGALSH